MPVGRTLLLARFAAAVVLSLAAVGLSANPPAPVNSFPRPAVDEPVAAGKGRHETAVLSGGCFWGLQAVFEHTKGVLSATSGYAGGNPESAHYELVAAGNTGHAESVQISYDPAQISYGQILMIFFSVAHNPTELNKQGPDWGTQYRSSVFYLSDDQKRIAAAYIAQLDTAKVFPQKIVTQIVAGTGFFPAEAGHQDYVKRHPADPYVAINDLPKLATFKKQFPELYREN